MNTIIAFSAGGHYIEAMRAIYSIKNDKDVFYVTYKEKHLINKLPKDRTFFIMHPMHCFIIKRLILFLINFFQSLYVYFKINPKIVISTGADVTLSLMLISKLFGSKIIFIESGANVTRPSLTGRLIYPFADLFIIQWKELEEYYPNAKLGSPLL